MTCDQVICILNHLPDLLEYDKRFNLKRKRRKELNSRALQKVFLVDSSSRKEWCLLYAIGFPERKEEWLGFGGSKRLTGSKLQHLFPILVDIPIKERNFKTYYWYIFLVCCCLGNWTLLYYYLLLQYKWTNFKIVTVCGLDRLVMRPMTTNLVGHSAWYWLPISHSP